MIGFVKFNLLVGLAMVLLSAWAYADTVCQEKSGKKICGAGEVPGFNYLGDVVLNGTKVSSPMKVIGDLEMHYAETGDMNVMGDMTATESELTGSVIVKGNAEIANSQLKAPLRIVGDAKISNTQCFDETAILGDVTVNNVYFGKSLTLTANQATFSAAQTHSITFDASEQNQHLSLTTQSTVDGDITFTAGNGTVSLAEGSKVLGKVVGGVINQQ